MRKRNKRYELPCGLRHCPICPPVSLLSIPDEKIIRLESNSDPPAQCKRQPRNGEVPALLCKDQDGPSASWGIIVKAYEDSIR